MEKQKIVMVLLIVAIVLSLATVVVGLTADTDYASPRNCADAVTCVNEESDSGNVAIEILPPTGGSA